MFQVGCFQPFRKLDRSQRTAEAQRTGDTERRGPRAMPSAGVDGGAGRGLAPPACPASLQAPARQQRAARCKEGCKRLRSKAILPHLICSV